MTNPDSAILEMYKARVQIMLAQQDKMWTRFQYFLAIDSGLAGLYFNKPSYALTIFGLCFSVLWFVIGAQDHFFLRSERHRVHLIESVFFLPSIDPERSGNIPTVNKTPAIPQKFHAFKIPHLGVSAFVAWFGLVFAVFWFIVPRAL